VEGKSFLKEIYKDLRSSFLVIGLTGRLGAGVSTTAERINEVFVDTEETQKFLSCVKCCDWLKQIDKYEQLRARRLEKFWAGLNLVSNTNNYKPKILRVRLILLLLFRRIWDLWKDETIDKLLEFSKRKEKEPVKKLNNESKLRELMENLLFEISNLKIPDKLIASFDTIVVHDNTVLGKPLNRNHAFDMLNLLSGKTHKVITSYTLYQKQYSLNRTKFVITEVTFKSLKDDEINWYINTDEPYDKAGAYAIQGIGAFMVKGIRGSYTNVVGLPLSEFLEDLLKIKDILKIGM
jgi:septum formation protein